MEWTIISGVIGIAGFVISLINAVHYYISRRIKLDVEILKCYERDIYDNHKLVIVNFRFDNKSQLPISVTDAQLVIKEKSYSEFAYPVEIASYRKREHGTVVERKFIYNDHLPVSLTSLSSCAVYIAFSIPVDIPKNSESEYHLLIRTNRGKEVKLKCEQGARLSIRSTLLPRPCKNHFHL